VSIRIDCDQPTELLSSIKNAIDKGHVETWAYDKDGDFTHSTTQWKNRRGYIPKSNKAGCFSRLLNRQTKISHLRYMRSITAASLK